MANKPIDMSKLKRLMRVVSEGGSLNDIVRICHVSKRDAKRFRGYLSKMPLPLNEMYKMDEFTLGKMIRPEAPKVPQPDARKDVLDKEVAAYARESQRPHKTLQYEWEKYIKLHPDGYQYTQFKKYVNEYIKNHDYKFTNTYEPGEIAMFDPAGDPLYIKGRFDLKGTPVSVLCAVMPYAGFAFMTAMPDERIEYLFDGMNKALAYFGALPKVCMSDNMTQWVKHMKKKYDLQFTDALDQWCMHYDVQPRVARIKHPRDKASVEGIVYKFYIYIYARLEDETFETVDELNSRIYELVDEFNDRPKEREGLSPREIYEKEEKPLMRPLPKEMYTYKHRKEFKKISASYLLSIGEEHHLYRVPYQYVGQKAVAVWDLNTVEIYVGNERVAVHPRSLSSNKPTINENHMPPQHQAWVHQKGEFNAASFMDKAREIGPFTTIAMDQLLHGAQWVQQQYRLGYTLLSWARKYGKDEVEKACQYLITNGKVAPMPGIEAVLKKDISIDKPMAQIVSLTPKNDHVRGSGAYKIGPDFN